jgi:hypothetical protein
MNGEHAARRLEKALGEDERTHELGIKIRASGDRLIAQGEVASQERRQAVLEVLRDLEPGATITDQLTVSAEALQPPVSIESIEHSRACDGR